MDIEWANDGPSGRLFVVQACPETIHSAAKASRLLRYDLETAAPPLVSGAAIGTAVAAGKACVVRTPADLGRYPEGAILVAENTESDWVPIMKRARGIVTDHRGITSHAAIVSRELGVPAVVGTGSATVSMGDGAPITLSCAARDKGHVYPGELPFLREEIDLGGLPETRTKLMLNIADPASALGWWKLPAKGVGLARMEFVIANIIRAHPMALLHPERTAKSLQRRLLRLTRGYASGADYLVDRLASGIARLAAPWFPHPAIIRLSDFKTNEYARLIGGAPFEPVEENPMIGFRGASRYHDDRYREGFALECKALKRARDDMGFNNIIPMIPFCRTPAEADLVISEMERCGLRRGDNGLEIHMMCEIPANVVRAGEFAQRFDGFSIGSNDLTQLLLGIRPRFRHSQSIVRRARPGGADVDRQRYRERACGRYQDRPVRAGPSDHADFAAFLVREGIDSIPLSSDSFVKALQTVAATEPTGL